MEKLYEVPDLSARWNVVIFVPGSFTPGLSFLIAASSHVVIFPLKIFARVCADRFNGALTPETLYITAIAPGTSGMLIALLPLPHRASALGWSSTDRGKSEPAKSTCFCSNAVTPAPEPLGL